MDKIIKMHWLEGVLVLLILAVGYFIWTDNQTPSIQNSLPATNNQTNVTPEILMTESPTPTVTTVPTANKTTITTPNGPANGQISCNYLVPVGGNTFGTASVKAVWSNLIVSKSGKGQAAVCVTANSIAPTLMSLDNLVSGSRTNSVTWLAPNASYLFSLFDNHGGDLPNCGGTLLASCRISTPLPKAPTPGGGRH